MVSELTHLLDEIRAANTIAWSIAAIPSREDEQCIRLIELLKRLSAEERLGLFARPELSVRIQVFVFRMAELAVRATSVSLLETAATALAMEGCPEREAYSLLALIVHSAKKLGIDGDSLIRRAMTFADDSGKERLLSFLSTDSKLRTIEAIGFRETNMPEGFTYKFDLSAAMPFALRRPS